MERETEPVSRKRGTFGVLSAELGEGRRVVALSLDPDAALVSGDGDRVPGYLLELWEARLLAYTLLHHAEAAEHGLASTAQV